MPFCWFCHGAAHFSIKYDKTSKLLSFMCDEGPVLACDITITSNTVLSF